MKKLCVFLSFALVFPLAHAEEALGMRYFNAMKLEKQFEGIAESISAALPGQMAAVGLEVSEDVAPILTRQQERVMDLLARAFLSDSVKEQMAANVEKVFSEAELKELIEFYESPIGQVFVDKSPALMREQVAVTQRVMQQVGPALQTIMAQTQQQIRAIERKGEKP